MNPTPWATPDLQSLVDLFYDDPAELGIFEELPSELVPEKYRSLLAHDKHMTVTLEDFHQSQVSVDVLQFNRTATHYSRKIILRRISDGLPVLYGIVRLSLNFLPPHVQDEIEAQQTPLGRVLIQNDILRKVKLLSLWKVCAGVDLAHCFGAPQQEAGDEDLTWYGRTALIYCDGLPAVELLEIARIA